MVKRQLLMIAVAGSAWMACASSTRFISTWKAPDAAPLALRHSNVVAVVMSTDPALRREAEDTLAREITKRGAQGVAMYTLLEEAHPGNETDARQALEAAQIEAAVVMRPMGTEKELVSVPQYHGTPAYAGYYGGYYSYGWGSAWDTQVYTNTIVSVETLVYSLDQNKLVWGGQSQTTNPENVEKLVKELAKEVAQELQKEGLIAGS